MISLLKSITFSVARNIIMFALLLCGVLFYGKIILTKAEERSHLTATNSYVLQDVIPVGIDGYGYIRSFNFKIGDRVNGGDVLFTYFGKQLGRTDDGDSQKSTISHVSNDSGESDLFAGFSEIPVKAMVPGIIKSIHYSQGSYVSQDKIVLEMLSSQTVIHSVFPVKPDQIGIIKVGYKTESRLPDGTIIDGQIINVYPYYNGKDQTMEAEIHITGADTQTYMGLINGMPVSTIVIIDDKVGRTIENRFYHLAQQVPLINSIL